MRGEENRGNKEMIRGEKRGEVRRKEEKERR